MTSAGVDRRRALHLLAACGAASSACGADDRPAAPIDASTAFAETDDTSDAGDTSEVASCDAGSGVYVGGVDDFPNGQFFKLNLGSNAAIVVRDDDGFYAMRAVCTHAVCTLDPPDAFGETRCPCHGARFSGRGDPIEGPATASLPHLLVVICGRKVYVDDAREIDPYARAVP